MITLLIGLVFAIVAGIAGADVLDNLKTGGFDDPQSDSVAAADVLADRFPGSDPKLVLVVDVSDGLDSAAGREALDDIVGAVDDVDGASVTGSYAESEQLRSDTDRGVVLVALAGDEDTVQRATTALRGTITEEVTSATVRFGGIAGINDDLNAQVKTDIIVAETIAIPITLVLLFFAFRGVVAALLPVGVAGVTILGSLGLLNVVAQLTSVSLFAVNLVTALGLGLAIDYCLLFLTRYRDERSGGATDEEALRIARRTTGRTIVFSGVVVAAALATLMLFDQYFLRSFAIAGLVIVACSVVGAVVLLPAALTLLGRRIDWGRLHSRRPAGAEGRFWYRVGDHAYRRPWLAVPVIALLIAMAAPFAHAEFGVPDERVLPADAESRVVADIMRSDFDVAEADAVSVVTEDWAGTDRELDEYAAELSSITGVEAVTTSLGSFVDGRLVVPADARTEQHFRDGSALWLQVATDVVPYSPEGSELVRDVRAVNPGAGSTVLVGGLAAQMIDIGDSISARLPFAAAAIALMTLIILFLFTGSVLLPIKALVLNVVGLVGILGVIVFLFQDGNLSDVLGFTPSPIAISIPILLFCIAFGLSMDYEVFLLARIQERFRATGDLAEAVRSGLGASGPIITAAAAILAVSFFAMATSGVSIIKMLGIGTGIAILIDAILIRGVLVPVFMRVAGRYNWWAPRWLAAIHRRIGITEG
ncbi:MMPL family transporter [Plantibacter sp. VKM Ac-2885]|uniref:MMPL family transporter n=1 Tax=Plantibacter sp. VKM Ac-2885 TaxID=2783828 RepID=UPI00188ACA6F|nr:MMPL family transporter [Plantibacter sp. VKM Ac-2885]